jgi:hypothetical protein
MASLCNLINVKTNKSASLSFLQIIIEQFEKNGDKNFDFLKYSNDLGSIQK